jgi:predicted ATPase
LEPSSLRQPAEFTSPSRLESDGKNLPSTLYRLEHSPLGTSANLNVAKGAVYAQIANRLSGLLLDVRDVRVDRDEQRELLSVVVTDRDGTALPATALSDGTLRFLALAVLELDPETTGVVCLEEPENGIHPARIPAMLQLLQDMAMDTEEEIGPDNPLRQVIINTHSPALVAQVPDDSLVIAELKETCREGKRFRAARFGCLPETWRHKAETPEVSKGILLSYLNPIVRGLPDKKRGSTKRVVDRLTKWIDWPQVSSS